MTTLEKDVLQSVQQATSSAIRECLTKYDSPLIRLVKLMINWRDTAIDLQKTLQERNDEIANLKEELLKTQKELYNPPKRYVTKQLTKHEDRSRNVPHRGN